jgi:uncharacterized membrane protein
MDLLTILLLIGIILLILSRQQRIMDHFKHIEDEIRQLREKLDHSKPATWRPADPETKPAPEPVVRAVAETRPQPVVPVIETPSPASDRPKTPATKDPLAPVIRVPSGRPPYDPASSPERQEKGFFERHPDLEKFIGENLVSKIGIAILVLAIGFFVKYAIDNDWIGPVGRVGIGLICGAILVGLAHKLRKTYESFSSVLVGGGLAIFYFTITLAYHQYALFSQTTAFIIMLVITAFAVILSLAYDRQELAIIALVGGFAAPFMVSDGSGNFKVLFSYLLILNLGLLVIAYNKAWRLLNLLAFLFTSLLFATWLATLPYETGTDIYRGGLFFATAFYILFFVINIAHTVRENKKFIASDFGILLANTCFYFGVGLWMLGKMHEAGYQGVFSASMGIFNLAGTWFLMRKQRVDSNVLYLLIGITLSFVSLTAPLQLHGHFITLFWASEAVLLYWLSGRSGIRVIRWASLLVWGAMFVSLIMDWADTYYPIWDRVPPTVFLPVIFNKGFITGVYSSLSCFALFLLRRREEKSFAGTGTSTVPEAADLRRIAFLLTGSLLLFTTGAQEIHYQFANRYPETGLDTLYLLLYTFGFITLLTSLGGRRNWFGSPWTVAALLTVCILVYLCFIPDSFDIQRRMLEQRHYGNHFIAHWIGVLLVALVLYRLIGWWRKGSRTIDPVFFTWVMGILILIFLSAEIQLIVNNLFYLPSRPLSKIQDLYYRAGLPILWGLCSFSFMWLGFRHKFKPLRILSLVVFSITLLKLFLFDIRDIPVAGKIAAFFCLGVLLLVISFMYQRLKKIIVIFFLLSSALYSRAQQGFAYRSELDTARQTGLYKITLMPDLLAKCKEDLSDLRIVDSAGNAVPYVEKSDLPLFTSENFTPFPILSNVKLVDSNTEVVLANGLPGNISSLLLVMKNISVRRTAILSGSDDRAKWFAIREHIELQEAGSDTADHFVQSISFPSSNYRFFKLILEDKGLLPVNLLGAGITTRSFTIGKYLGVPFPALVQKDSNDKHSYISLQYRDRYRIDKINLLVRGPLLFKRNARLYDRSKGGDRLLGETTLSPGNTSFTIPAVKTDSLMIEIDNEDNKPLLLQAVQTAQLNQYLLTWLQAGSRYSLLAGNANAQTPGYDLKYFVDSLTKDPQEIPTGPVQPIAPGIAVVSAPHTDHSGLLLWGILSIVLVLLASLSYKMMKSIPKDSNHDRP